MKFTLESHDVNDLLSEALRARGWAVPDTVQYRFSDDGTGGVQVEIYGVDLPTQVSRRESAPAARPSAPQAQGARPQAPAETRPRTKTAAPAKEKNWFEDPTVPPPPPGPVPKRPKRVELKDRTGGPDRPYRPTPKYGLAEPGEKRASRATEEDDDYVYTPTNDYAEAPPKGFEALKAEARAEDAGEEEGESDDDTQEEDDDEEEEEEDPRPGARMVSSKLEDFGDPTHYRNEM
jgi:hypothetical protein